MNPYAAPREGEEPWQERAACRGRGEEMYADFTDKEALAKALNTCFACPVREECLIEALRYEGDAPTKYRHGIWGGARPAERTAIRREWERENGIHAVPAPTHADLKPCGTPAAARRHRRRGEPLCKRCEDAERLAWQERPRTAAA